MEMLKFHLLIATLLSGAVSQSCNSCVDLTVVPDSTGEKVVLASVRLVEDSNIFSEDHGTLRRIAYAETRDGILFEKNNGGIWKVGEGIFNSTKTSSSAILSGIDSFFNIDWNSVEYSDLDKPLFSALAARIFLQQQQNSGGNISTDVAQVELWVTNYSTNANEDDYYSAISNATIDNDGM